MIASKTGISTSRLWQGTLTFDACDFGSGADANELDLFLGSLGYTYEYLGNDVTGECTDGGCSL